MVKKGSKKAAEDREFEEAISEFANEKEALKTTSSQVTLFHLIGFGVASIPFVLYAFQLFSGEAPLSIFLYFFAGIAISGFILGRTYNEVSTRSRNAIYLKSMRELKPDRSDDKAIRNLILYAHSQAASYSFFTVNLTFMLGYLFLGFYALLPVANSLPSTWHFVICTIIPALTAFGFANIRVF